MRARWLFSLAILALPLLQGGCATPALWNNVSGERDISDKLKEVTHAYRKAGGHIVICVEGWPNRADTDSPAKAFSIAFPAGAFTDNSRNAPKLDQSRRLRGLPSFHVKTGSVQGPCPAPDAVGSEPSTPVPVRTVHDTEFGLAYFKDERQIAPKRYFNNRPMTPALYKLVSNTECEVEDRLRIVYVHDSPVFNGERVLEIRVGRRRINVGRNYAYLTLLPVTIAVDLVALVGLFPMYLVTGMIADKDYDFTPNWDFFDTHCLEDEPAK